eukprot:1160255-Pelagomonas_calceolata.AAC.6
MAGEAWMCCRAHCHRSQIDQGRFPSISCAYVNVCVPVCILCNRDGSLPQHVYHDTGLNHRAPE